MASVDDTLRTLGHVVERQTESRTKVVEKTGSTEKTEKANKDRILAKHFRVHNFDGDKAKWDDWNFAFKRNVRSMSKDAYDVMKNWEDKSEDIDEKLKLTDDQVRRSAELYDVLCQTCTGEALMIVKSVDDMEGIRAWQVLCKKYRPKTRASAVRMMSEAINLAKIKDLDQYETVVTKWEDRIKKLCLQFNEKLTENMKIAIFTNMSRATSRITRTRTRRKTRSTRTCAKGRDIDQQQGRGRRRADANGHWGRRRR